MDAGISFSGVLVLVAVTLTSPRFLIKRVSRFVTGFVLLPCADTERHPRIRMNKRIKCLDFIN